MSDRWVGLQEDLDELGGVDRTDYGRGWYKNSDRVRDVSIETARNEQLARQEALDNQVEAENVFPEDPEHVTRRGLMPCKRAKSQV